MSELGRLPLVSIRGLHDGRTDKRAKHVAIINDNLVSKKELVCIFKKISQVAVFNILLLVY